MRAFVKRLHEWDDSAERAALTGQFRAEHDAIAMVKVAMSDTSRSTTMTAPGACCYA